MIKRSHLNFALFFSEKKTVLRLLALALDVFKDPPTLNRPLSNGMEERIDERREGRVPILTEGFFLGGGYPAHAGKGGALNATMHVGGKRLLLFFHLCPVVGVKREGGGGAPIVVFVIAFLGCKTLLLFHCDRKELSVKSGNLVLLTPKKSKKMQNYSTKTSWCF